MTFLLMRLKINLEGLRKICNPSEPTLAKYNNLFRYYLTIII